MITHVALRAIKRCSSNPLNWTEIDRCWNMLRFSSSEISDTNSTHNRFLSSFNDGRLDEAWGSTVWWKGRYLVLPINILYELRRIYISTGQKFLFLDSYCMHVVSKENFLQGASFWHSCNLTWCFLVASSLWQILVPVFAPSSHSRVFLCSWYCTYLY